MANSWSELSWNAGNWNDLSDIDFIPTGINLTTSLNTVDAFPNEGWGSDRWGIENWGQSGLNVTVTGNDLTVAVGSEFGWSQSTWNSSEFQWGGFSPTSVAIGQQIDVTGTGLTVNLNSVIEIITVDTFPTGIELTTSTGTVDADPDASVTGIELTSAVGTALGYNSTGWGRFYWGEEVWGDNGIWVTASVTGQELTLTLDSVTPIANANIDITGEILTIEEGEVDPSPDATVTGIGMTCDLAVGTVIIGTANVDVTGTELTITLASVEAEAITFADVTGIALTLDLGTAFGGASVEVDITGNILTIAQNSISVQSWTKINTGTVVTWTEIDTAA